MKQTEAKSRVYALKLLYQVEAWLIDNFKDSEERYEALCFIYTFFREKEPE